MTRVEKLSAVLAAVLVAVCVIAAFKPSPSGIVPERSADIKEVMKGGDEDAGDELMPGDTVNINTAPMEELRLLPGVGDILAQRIIDYREANGDFSSIDQLVDAIDGIGESNIEQMRMYIALEDDVS